MRLYAAVVPPERARVELADLVQSVAPGTPELTQVPVDGMRIPITSFGNVAQEDSERLLGQLRKVTAGWSRPELRFHGSAALEFEGDESVWAKVDGDVDGLLQIGRGVPVAVQPLGFLVDRRQFRPWLAVGSITAATKLPYLEKLTAALDSFEGQPWTPESLTIFRRVPADASGIEERIHEEMPFGSA